MNRAFSNRLIALISLVLTIAFIVVSMTNKTFFDWVFERHHNQWSWYIRPIFIIPFCYFAYRKNLAGISATVFGLFTSMAWFNKPNIVNESVIQFLQFEKDWLYGEWTTQKVILILTVPISFALLGLAFWKRSLYWGIIIVVLVAIGKIVWSIQNAGESGKSIILPALIGLIICCVLIWIGAKRIKK